MIATRGRPDHHIIRKKRRLIGFLVDKLIAKSPKRRGRAWGWVGTGMGEMGVPVAINHALASGIPTVITSTLSRFADSQLQRCRHPLGSPYVENEIEAGGDAARCFRYSHYQIAAE